MALALAMVAGAIGCNRSTPPTSAQEEDIVEAVEPPAKAAFDATLSIVNNNGAVRYHGRVDSEATRDSLVEALDGAYGGTRAGGDIAIDQNARTPGWTDGLAAFLTAFDVPGAAIDFEGGEIELTGSIPIEDRIRLHQQARTAFPDARLTGLFKGLETDGEPSTDPAAMALSGLASNATPNQLADALNLMTIEFEPGSAKVASDSLAIISQAGQAIARIPGAKRIEIGGHANDTGDPADDLALSRKRAEAVKVQLIINGVNPGRLETKGHGAATTADGRNNVVFSVLN